MSADDVRDQVDSKRLEARQSAVRAPTDEYEIIPDDPDDPEEWTLLEGDVTDNYGAERWLTVDDHRMVLPLEDCI